MLKTKTNNVVFFHNEDFSGKIAVHELVDGDKILPFDKYIEIELTDLLAFVAEAQKVRGIQTDG